MTRKRDCLMTPHFLIWSFGPKIGPVDGICRQTDSRTYSISTLRQGRTDEHTRFLVYFEPKTIITEFLSEYQKFRKGYKVLLKIPQGRKGSITSQTDQHAITYQWDQHVIVRWRFVACLGASSPFLRSLSFCGLWCRSYDLTFLTMNPVTLNGTNFTPL